MELGRGRAQGESGDGRKRREDIGAKTGKSSLGGGGGVDKGLHAVYIPRKLQSTRSSIQVQAR